jgi:hypothetical protein
MVLTTFLAVARIEKIGAKKCTNNQISTQKLTIWALWTILLAPTLVSLIGSFPVYISGRRFPNDSVQKL